MFRFPKDAERKELWTRQIQRLDVQPNPNSTVCEKHFREEFVIRFDSLKRQDGTVFSVKRVIPKLTQDAYHSLLLEFPSHTKKRNVNKSKKAQAQSKTSCETGSLSMEVEDVDPANRETLEVKPEGNYSEFVLEETTKSSTADCVNPLETEKKCVWSGSGESDTVITSKGDKETFHSSNGITSPSLSRQMLTCQWCKKTFHSLSILDIHVLIYHKKTKNDALGDLTSVENVQVTNNITAADTRIGEVLYKCSHCDKSFKKSRSLKLHCEIGHRPRDRYKCFDCNKTFTLMAWQRHRPDLVQPNPDTLNTNPKLGQGNMPHRCTICGRKFTWFCAMMKHQYSCMGYMPYKCTLCDRTFVEKKGLEEHKPACTAKEHLKCSLCDKVFKVAEAWTKHQRTCKGKKQHKCADCGKVFASLFTLRSHGTVHSGEKQYLCPVCGKLFRLECILKRHLWRHSGYKPYLCTDCGMAFIRLESFRRHRCFHLKSKNH